ncbi:GGDEF domain-containing protein [Litchfieldella rifensis]|uniref:GGDEF domain-containing protein n=1 Tax=Litchfieldella rifensis TaxID=762643 RepID=A0ABV7LUU3_9GAMM
MREETFWPFWLYALIYAVGALLMFGYATWHYLMGDFMRILLPAVLGLMLLGASLLHLTDHRYQRLSAYLVLISCFLLFAVEIGQARNDVALWIGLPPLLALLLLPLGPAMLLNLILAPLWLALLSDDQVSRDMVFTYVAVIVLGALVPLEQRRQQAFLEATDPMDPECQALNSSAIHELLGNEFARATLLQRRLSVLVIHLPQLEMAHEQFGTRLRLELLQRFCAVAHHTCRVHDSLGRTQSSLFWLLLPDTGETGALMVRHRLISALDATVLAETGAITSRIAVCSPHPGETWATFEQRLQIKGQALMESTQ